MRVIEINMVHNGSTGKIMLNIAKRIVQNGDEVKTFSAYIFSKKHYKLPQAPNKDHEFFGYYIENAFHTILGQLTGYNGKYSYFGSLKLINACKKFHPDIIHLHNLHAFCINLPMLFKYINKYHIPVVWTLHDCWAFTGHCAHFTMAKCEKWKTGCNHCPQLNDYPKMRVDRTKQAYYFKKKWFTGVENMTIVTPSEWLADLVKQSFLKDYPVKVIHNGIDLNVFQPTPSDFKEKYNIPDSKHILLGVAFGWGKRKGLDVFIELAKRLDYNKYQIVLVGTDEKTDKQLPAEIISIHRTQNQQELAEIYTAADVFVNPTREEVLGLVNIEANACGTPVITFKTGGSPECISIASGTVVDCDDIDAMQKEIERICENKPFTKENCINQAKQFDMNDRFQEYVDLYKEVIK